MYALPFTSSAIGIYQYIPPHITWRPGNYHWLPRLSSDRIPVHSLRSRVFVSLFIIDHYLSLEILPFTNLIFFRYKKYAPMNTIIDLCWNGRHFSEINIEPFFPPGAFVRANREKSNLIGWRQTLTSSPTNHIRVLLVRAKKIAQWKTGLRVRWKCIWKVI